MMENPYRSLFYAKQAAWHKHKDPDAVLAKHRHRAKYYRWLTKGWLPNDTNVPILDIGCGAGQFVYFLKQAGYTNVTGIDVDNTQIGLAQALGLACECEEAKTFFQKTDRTFRLVSMLDILEHFTMAEIFELLSMIQARLEGVGQLLLSVPNAESPVGSSVHYADLTHEITFTLTSLGEILYCHGLSIRDYRDPWPTPIDPWRKIYRYGATICRTMEGLRMRMMGLGCPRVWSPVMWVLAEKANNGQ